MIARLAARYRAAVAAATANAKAADDADYFTQLRITLEDRTR